VKRTVGYQWHLAELMARHGLHNTTDLSAHLTERGIQLSPSQVYRLVTQRPERVSLKLVAALCDIFDCDIADLVTVTAVDAVPRKKASGSSTGSNVVDLNSTIRPKRARVVRDRDS
jgi:DNA-binding Xre family transcriptional regulator